MGLVLTRYSFGYLTHNLGHWLKDIPLMCLKIIAGVVLSLKPKISF